MDWPIYRSLILNVRLKSLLIWCDNFFQVSELNYDINTTEGSKDQNTPFMDAIMNAKVCCLWKLPADLESWVYTKISVYNMLLRRHPSHSLNVFEARYVTKYYRCILPLSVHVIWIKLRVQNNSYLKVFMSLMKRTFPLSTFFEWKSFLFHCLKSDKIVYYVKENPRMHGLTI